MINRVGIFNNYWKDIFEKNALKLGYDHDQIGIYFEMVESIETLLKRNRTHEKAMSWE